MPKPIPKHKPKKSALAEAQERCDGLHLEPDLLAVFRRDVAAGGLVGEADNASLVYLTILSALLAKPACLKIGGVSSSGKSYTMDAGRAFVPSSAVLSLTSMSPKALNYADDDLRHMAICLAEAAPLTSNDEAAYMIRTLISEGRLAHKTVEFTNTGARGRDLNKDGPCAFVTTTTLPALDYDLETRILTIAPDESREQTRRILEDQAQRLNGAAPAAVDHRRWHALYDWLRLGCCAVEIPYARAIVDAIPDEALAVRMRRVGGLLFSYLSAITLLHHATREIRNGRIVATADDYVHAYRLLATPLTEGLEHGVAPAVRDVVQAVKDHHAEHDDKPPNQAAIAHALDLDSGTVSRHVKIALHHGYLRDDSRNPQNARLRTGDPLPSEGVVLPEPAAVFGTTRRDQGGSWRRSASVQRRQKGRK